MTVNGYRLFGLFDDGDLMAVAGVDILINMYYGRHVWIYDLVTDADHRSKGYGGRLLEFIEDWATERNCEKIAFSSGLQRDEAHRFYDDRASMDRASYVFTKDLDQGQT